MVESVGFAKALNPPYGSRELCRPIRSGEARALQPSSDLFPCARRESLEFLCSAEPVNFHRPAKKNTDARLKLPMETSTSVVIAPIVKSITGRIANDESRAA